MYARQEVWVSWVLSTVVPVSVVLWGLWRHFYWPTTPQTARGPVKSVFRGLKERHTWIRSTEHQNLIMNLVSGSINKAVRL